YGELGKVKTQLLPPQSFLLTPRGYFIELGALREVPLFASVENRPRWAVVGRDDIDPPFYGVVDLPERNDPKGFRVLGLLTDTDVFKAPFAAAAANTADGGVTLLVSSFD